jgi:signal transduction histidine kinase
MRGALRDRVAAVNGTLVIDSRREMGTIVRAHLPIDPSETSRGDAPPAGPSRIRDSPPRR